MPDFIVRPSNTEKDAFRVKLTAVSMLSLKLKSGDTCEIQSTDSSKYGRKRLAIAWEASGAGIKDSVVQTSKLLQDLYGFKLGDKITITRSSQPLTNADTVTLQSCGPRHDEQAIKFWEKYAKLTIPGTDECIALARKIQFKLGIDTAEFMVKDIGVPDAMIARVTGHTHFAISRSDTPDHSWEINFNPRNLGGLRDQITHVQDIVARVRRPIVKQYFQLYRPIQGILVYGAKGTGKTAFITALAQSGWSQVISWKPGTQMCESTEPRLVIIRSRHLLRNAGPVPGVTDELENLFNDIRGFPTLVIGEVQHPNDIDPTLRSEGKFAAEMELPIPSANQRKEILLALRGNDATPQDELLQEMAARTHGYVGADLYALMRRTLELASDRTPVPKDEEEKTVNGEEHAGPELEKPRQSVGGGENKPRFHVTSADLDAALQQIRPSALQEIFLETPNVHWSDIGGQHEIKHQLRNAVERPLKFADRMKKLGLQPKKGVLLYGPPGCSKTLLVRALATEAGLNFLAVKGAELISMYVGESERATREVFRKARAASPSIIFFDEIDAIASRGKSGSDLNVLTTLLNEMDGFEELRSVLVVAATNKPQNIDPALLRPGRFDNVVYIGPPDLEARKEIFQKRLEKIQYEFQIGLGEDIHEFAQSTEGFSGAEIVAICQSAGEYAFDADRETIISDDIRKAIVNTPKSITKEMLSEFEFWNATRMR
ncbi:uncharacterized protein Z518_08364 [Rhinocladiella mackenziei CBS 650.93]|uniref:AAA+ ATPase domain-containing protein n=1 Tax=Rhinocladiella mackenziei CBS 650.93 TaxID=1442369 RepID=A0A0D2GVZ4_9EURO|nr:uncharacterized protein Z518_08364 [Rhinocladiella mackenziei CBS 650.93]KIX02423.1 hypothetical protein Z518_08364 [Rhinocladiella mackenziei CBS 650.93]